MKACDSGDVQLSFHSNLTLSLRTGGINAGQMAVPVRSQLCQEIHISHCVIRQLLGTVLHNRQHMQESTKHNQPNPKKSRRWYTSRVSGKLEERCTSRSPAAYEGSEAQHTNFTSGLKETGVLSWLGAMRARMRLHIWVKCFLMVELQVYLQPQPKHEPTDASLSMGQARQLSWSPKAPSASVAKARPSPRWRLSFCIYKFICFTTTRSAINPPAHEE